MRTAAMEELRVSQGDEPAWVQWAAAAVLVLVFAFLILETAVWRPGWAFGDESVIVRLLSAQDEGLPWRWRWMQASLHQGALGLLALAVRPSLAGIHALGWALVVLESLLLFSLVKRWHGREAAAWAVAALLLSAQAWMRYRTLLGYQGVPLALLGSLWALVHLRGRAASALVGALMGALAMEYETAALAMPFVLGFAWRNEKGLRPGLPVALLSAAVVSAAIIAIEPQRIHAYLRARSILYTGGSAGHAFAGLAANLKGLVLGGVPMPYLGVHAWPMIAPWTWMPLGLGCAWAFRHERVLLAWAAALTLIPLSSSTGWGVPPHRLSGAAPALAWLAGLGLWRMRLALAHRAKAVLLGLLLVGAGLELQAWFRHMAVYGSPAWGRSSLMAEALRVAQAKAMAGGGRVSTALYRVPYPELSYLTGPQPTTAGGSAFWVALVPPVLGWSLPPEAQLLRRNQNEEPIFLLEARGPLAARFDSIERQLAGISHRELDLEERSSADRAWLKRPGLDPWALDLVLERDLWALRAGLPMGEDHAVAMKQPRSSPGPETRLADRLRSFDHAKALGLYEHVLARWPAYAPAIEGRVLSLKALGRADEAEGELTQRYRAAVLAAWPIYD